MSAKTLRLELTKDGKGITVHIPANLVYECIAKKPERGVTSRGLLTPKEKQVLPLLLRGLCNKEIAAELNMTKRTVQYHCGELYRKLHAQDRVQLIAQYVNVDVVEESMVMAEEVVT